MAGIDKDGKNRIEQHRDGMKSPPHPDRASEKPSEFWRSRMGKLNAASGGLPSFSWHAYKVWRNRARDSDDGWLDADELEPRRKRFRSFREARAFARKLKLNSGDEWRRYLRGELPGKGKCPIDIPGRPDETYKDQGWVSYSDWLGVTDI